MYIQREKHYKCSKCHSIDNVEFVTKENRTYLRCSNCGHKKLITTQEFTVLNTKKWQEAYKSTEWGNIEDF